MNHPNFENEEYQLHKNKLILLDDLYNGIDTAKKHIRKFPREDIEDYKDRIDEATLDNYLKSTIETLQNIIFRRPIDLTNIQNKKVIDWCDKINFKDSLNEFGKKVLKNREKDGFTFILVDSPEYDTEEIKSQRDQELNNIRPYFTNILRSQVINWEMDNFNQYIRFTISET